MSKEINLRDAIFEAWDNVADCPDGYRADFCPSCFYSALKAIIESGQK